MSEATATAPQSAATPEHDFIEKLRALEKTAYSANQAHKAWKFLSVLHSSGFTPKDGPSLRLGLLDEGGNILCEANLAQVFPHDPPEERKAKLDTVLSAFLDGAARGLVACLKNIQNDAGQCLSQIEAVNGPNSAGS